MSRLGKLFRCAVVAAAAASADRADAQYNYAPAPQAQPCPPVPCPPAGQPVQPGDPLNLTPSTPTGPAEATPSFSSTLAGAGVGESTAINGLGGYIDNAVPLTHFRLRYDDARDNSRPDRAEFFYAKCGCFRTAVPPQLDADGPPLPETSVDYQEILPYFEWAIVPRLSVFATVPIRFINPQINQNASGLGDVSFGAKYALIYGPCGVLSLQVRAIAPSGNASDGLGTGNWFIEPGILFLRQIRPRLQVFGEVKDQIPLSPQSDFTGNVLRYGLGTSLIALQGARGYVAPVAEFVGWTVLSGKESVGTQVFNSEGITIVNAKLGVRIGFGRDECSANPNLTRNDLYIGYGRPITGREWYRDIFRVEYRRFF